MPEPTPLLLLLHSRGDTRRFGHRLAACLQPGDLLVLEGDLGAGKTFLARAIARAMGVPSEIRVTSPTFELVHELPARIPLVHMDLYRLEQAECLRELGIGEPTAADVVCMVEWGDRFHVELGDEGLWLSLGAGALGTQRTCRLQARGARGARLLQRLRDELQRAQFHGRRCPRTPSL